MRSIIETSSPTNFGTPDDGAHPREDRRLWIAWEALESVHGSTEAVLLSRSGSGEIGSFASGRNVLSPASRIHIGGYLTVILFRPSVVEVAPKWSV